MLKEVRPDVVHVTTPPSSHFALARDALEAGAHVIVEKPATTDYAELVTLLEHARTVTRCLVEDYNYLFNAPMRDLLKLLESGRAGAVAHVEISLCLSLGEAKYATEPSAPDRLVPGGPVGEFLPHLASLAHAVVGAHRRVATAASTRRTSSALPMDEFRALVDAERGTANLVFSANARPDTFTVRVFAENLRASVGLFDARLTVEPVRDVPRQLLGFVNGMVEAARIGLDTTVDLVGKATGQRGSLDGLDALLKATYDAILAGQPPPVSLAQIDDVNRLLRDLLDPRFAL
jgi:predicted dehydrogenase